MDSERFVTADSVGAAWEESIRLLLAQRAAEVVDTTTGGGSIELQNVLIEILDPQAEPRVSDRFFDLDLISSYKTLFGRSSHKRPQDVVTVADRIYAWDTTSGKPLDQLRRIVAELKANPTSRRAIIQIWNPESDLPGSSKGTPSGHCYFYFSVRSGALNLTANSRSVDAWIGELPNLLTLTGLQKEVADKLSLPVGKFSHFLLSYHMYIRDLPAAMLAFQSESQ